MRRPAVAHRASGAAAGDAKRVGVVELREQAVVHGVAAPSRFDGREICRGALRRRPSSRRPSTSDPRTPRGSGRSPRRRRRARRASAKRARRRQREPERARRARTGAARRQTSASCAGMRAPVHVPKRAASRCVCTSASSRARRGRAAPGWRAGPRPPGAGASRTCGAGRGARSPPAARPRGAAASGASPSTAASAGRRAR